MILTRVQSRAIETCHAQRSEQLSGDANFPTSARWILPRWRSALQARGHPRFHARQIYSWIYAKGVTDFEQMTDLSRPLRADLPAAVPHFDAPRHPARNVDRRHDEVPARARRRPAHRIGVHSRHADQTFCVSTQVGCAMKCGFCLTGKMGLVRNLTAGEIAGQVRVLAHELGLRDHQVQHRPDGHGRAAAQLRQHDEGAAHAQRRAWACRLAQARDAFDRRRPARHSSGWRPSR